MKKKLIVLLLALCMVLSVLSACNKEGKAGDSATEVSNEYTTKTINGYDYKVAKDMTKEKITLTYYHFDQDETVKYLADRFMELYPNITVKTQYTAVADYNTTLNTMIADRKAPDVFMVSDADFALTNEIPMDISAYWNSDEETKNVLDTINDCGLGCFQTTGRFTVPVKYFPQAIYIDRNVMKTLNLEIPDQNWTWDQMIDIIDKATQEGADGMKYFGLGAYTRLDSYYGIAANQNAVGEFGFDGKKFDLSYWAVGEQQFSSMKLSKKVAPATQTPAMEAWMGDFDGWFGASGHVAVGAEAFWTFQNIWNTEAYKEMNMDWVPYVVPAVSEVDAGTTHKSIGTIDFGGVTNGCPYPREAYELLKFMSFGIDGWHTRIELYKDPNGVNASGTRLKHDVMPAPITKDQAIWDEYIAMFCEGMDEEHTQLWRDYFASCMKPIPFGWTSIAGYWRYCDEYFNKIGIHDRVDNGEGMAADYVDQATRKANWYFADSMLDYFGPDKYDILSDEEIAYYTQLRDENKE